MARVGANNIEYSFATQETAISAPGFETGLDFHNLKKINEI